MSEPLAHSADQERGIPVQTYRDHVFAVSQRALAAAQGAARYAGTGASAFLTCVRHAAAYHDLGKLSEANQAVLSTGRSGRLPVNHVDAGVATLLEVRQVEAALSAVSHHRGLCSLHAEAAKGKDGFLRDIDTIPDTEANGQNYLQAHLEITGETAPAGGSAHRFSGLRRRLALSCLVEGDHGDTETHYGQERVTPPNGRWKERLAALDAYIERLNSGPPSPRSEQRQAIYAACRAADTSVGIRACDSPVGTGKTTAVMVHLLRVAVEHDLRRVIVVLPFTNIIKQSVQVYRDALTLPGEDPETVVAEHHHQSEFSTPALRHLTGLWDAPITVTTAVQFFESLASNRPARLRKLHNLPGSAVFVDETHTAVPTWFWPQVWAWMTELANDWRTHFVLASGSLPEIWSIERLVGGMVQVPDLLPASVRKQAAGSEKRRISYTHLRQPLDRIELRHRLMAEDGPRLVIVNTVQSAAVLADCLRSAGHEVLHLSTALTPRDRDAIVDRVKTRLEQTDEPDWSLVATSCVEAGMDFSFGTAFRERCSTASLIQIGGRVNRHGGPRMATVFDFALQDPLCNFHPAFTSSRTVLAELFAEGALESWSPSELVTEAMRRELQLDYSTRAAAVQLAEKTCDYPEVAKLARIIATDTRLVVIDDDLADAVAERKHVPFRVLQRYSVQVWANRLDRLPIEPIAGSHEIYRWTGQYDPEFLGYMADVVGRLSDADDVGGMV